MLRPVERRGVYGGVLIVNAAGRVETSRWVSMEGASELFAQEAGPTRLGSPSLRSAGAYTQSKPRLVMHLPVTNEKWLCGPPHKKRDTGGHL